jgi:hypothetical protein
MTPSTRFPRRLVVCFLAVLLVAGCGGGVKKVPVSGKVTRGGKAVTAGNTQMVQLLLVPVVEPGQPRTNIALTFNKDDGTFTSPVPIPEGKYRLDFQILDKMVDTFNGAFHGDKAPLCEIKADVPIEIDLDKPQP